MRIICPTCASHYEVEADKIGANGQLVRCAQCREVWLARIPAPVAPSERAVGAGATILPATRAGWPDREPNAFAAAAVAVASEADPIDFLAARARLRRRATPVSHALGRSGAAGLLSLLAVCATAAGLMIGFRAAIVDRLPGTAPAFAALGLPVDTAGLVLQDVHSVVVAEGDKTVLSLEGQIANLRDGPTTVPNLTVVMRDVAQSPLYSWTANAPKPTLAKGETVAFRSRLATPPTGGHDVRVSFADAGTKGVTTP